VYFACPALGGDDIAMTHTKGNVIQYNEYYPFGMQTANSWTRENTTGNNFLANGGTELNTTSNLYDLAYRHYDPVLGRMNGVDPMASKYSSLTPYNFSFNDPVTFADPSGADPADYYFYGGYFTYDDWIPQRNLGWQTSLDRSGAGKREFGQSLSSFGGDYGGDSWQSSTFAGVPMPGGGGITRDQDGNININWDRIGNRGASWSANGSNGSWSVPNEIFNPWINAWQPYDPHIERLVNRENYRLRLRYSQQVPPPPSESLYTRFIDDFRSRFADQMFSIFKGQNVSPEILEQYIQQNGNQDFFDAMNVTYQNTDPASWNERQEIKLMGYGIIEWAPKWTDKQLWSIQNPYYNPERYHTVFWENRGFGQFKEVFVIPTSKGELSVYMTYFVSEGGPKTPF
jgi:RHS repeat-associated protein